MIPESPSQARFLYFLSAGALLFMNTGGIVVAHHTGGLENFLPAVMLGNLIVFGTRLIYTWRHHRTLFSPEHYRSTEKATRAERLGLYALGIVILAGIITELPDSLITASDDLAQAGETIMALLLITPAATYLTADYGTLRDITRTPTTDPNTPPTKLAQLSQHITPDNPTYHLLHIATTLGHHPEWTDDTLTTIATTLDTALADTGLPSVGDEDAEPYWQRLAESAGIDPRD